MNIEKELADLQENILKITSLYGTTGNNQKRELQTSFNKLESAISVTRCCETLKLNIQHFDLRDSPSQINEYLNYNKIKKEHIISFARSDKYLTMVYKVL
jgi:hypothetical protein